MNTHTKITNDKLRIKKMQSLILYLILFILLACTKEKKVTESNYPQVTTGLVTNINASGATFNGSFLQAGNSEVIDHGFVFDTIFVPINTVPDVERSEKISLGSSNGKGSFTATANFGLISGKTYYVSAYAQNKDRIFYAESVSFVSMGGLPPEISEIVPDEGIRGDIVVIKGKYFHHLPQNNIVKFGDEEAIIIAASDTELTVRVPKYPSIGEHVDVFVTTAGKTAQRINGFKYLKPAIGIESIEELNNSNVRFLADVYNNDGEEILDHGFIWGTQLTTAESLDEWMSNSTNDVLRKFLLEKGTAISLGKLENPGQFSYDANVGLRKKHIVIAYIKTNKYVAYSKVYIYEKPTSILWNRKNLTFSIPRDANYFILKNNKIYLSYNSTGYYSWLDSTGELDLLNYQFVNKKKCPETINTFHFGIGEVAYFSLNNHTMWKFNTTTDTWTSIGNPNIPDYGLVTVAFTQRQKGYNVIYNYNLQGYYIYEFDPNTDIWTQKNESAITGIVWRENVFSFRNKVYLFDSHDNLWYYDEILATFQLKSHINIGYGNFIVSLNDRVYMIKQTGNVYDIFTYDLENDFTEKFCTLYNNFPNANTTLVVLNSKILFLTSPQTCLYELDLSKFQ